MFLRKSFAVLNLFLIEYCRRSVSVVRQGESSGTSVRYSSLTALLPPELKRKTRSLLGGQPFGRQRDDDGNTSAASEAM